MINYLKGDATHPTFPGNKLIVHICNDVGGWGKGFVLAISKRWKKPEIQYRDWYKRDEQFALGEVQFVNVENDIWVANVIDQHDLIRRGSLQHIPPIRYEAIATGLGKVAAFAKKQNASVHMPRIGCGLAGDTWDKMEPIIINTLSAEFIPVYVYDL